MNTFYQGILLLTLKVFFAAVNYIPLTLRLKLFELAIGLFALLRPSFRARSLTHLELAFPEKSEAWRTLLLKQNIASLARLLVDIVRLDKLDRGWVEQHVIFERKAEFEELKRRAGSSGILIATGHLSSFELLAHSAALLGHPLSFVVRNFQLSQIDQWWNSIRQKHGNTVIDRQRAFRKIVQHLSSGRDVGVLFDQNVSLGNAVFVDWFGKPAATTRALGLAALHTRCPMIVASIRYIGGERYSIDWKPCELSDVYENTRASREEKVKEITRRASSLFEQMIRQSPHAWFWMHRRWRTQPTEANKQEKINANGLLSEESASSGRSS